ncbi:hypothetical protein GLOIN_2v877558 [Rhizophagus irregularis DAOM 181602=DAOM 197198]|uniref:Uncharacterized protein n=1 Tax=Rhizophagus irregularis (strain DAOM 181602 / DAOM 197198 / MUCL 43194) TaxID=747089 RepID=A0A2P4P0J1_RHIID|nr:hypothetical protein GLOIN_2v877558 [Rhizophagus irregularis DAOM 181602=DAOM 197198]POG58907.1 hypothetical protein GLOIN_2v877558 [Rhizophagus irregularis DAOM 181602=DAOM 197198]|eukprot:XP_025165773.1 hypothetical protein GLOIN_2v877558 [Rhizophagus irregularis DAOM 181602=DAOM 197198]
MARVLPTQKFQILRWSFSLNPGPFNIKEHVCIFVATGAGGGSAYATDIISIHTRAFLSSLNQFWSRFSFAYEHTDYRVWFHGIS